YPVSAVLISDQPLRLLIHIPVSVSQPLPHCVQYGTLCLGHRIAEPIVMSSHPGVLRWQKAHQLPIPIQILIDVTDPTLPEHNPEVGKKRLCLTFNEQRRHKPHVR